MAGSGSKPCLASRRFLCGLVSEPAAGARPDLSLSSRSSRAQSALTKIRRRIPEIAQDYARRPMQGAWSDRSGPCGLEFRRHRRHEFRPAVGFDRCGQSIEHCTFGIGEGQRHAGVSMSGDLTRRYPRFDLDRRYAIARTRPCQLFGVSLDPFPSVKFSPPSGFAWITGTRYFCLSFRRSARLSRSSLRIFSAE